LELPSVATPLQWYNSTVRTKEVDMASAKETVAVARQSFSEVLNRAAYGRERIIIKRRGKNLAAVVPLEDLELLEELEARMDLDEARRRMKETGSTSWTKLKKELGL
jgi:prevent-host-death family protein